MMNFFYSIPKRAVTFMRFAILILAIFDSQTLLSQFIYNSSFEGIPRENIPPEKWEPCHEFSTPDTQPGYWEVQKTASDGNTFIGLVTRGNLGPYANNNEDIQTLLSSPLLLDKAYHFNLDLAFSESWGHSIDFGSTFLNYDTPAKLRIYGGSVPCEKLEILWESPTIDHTEWKTYSMTLIPTIKDVNFLILEASYINDSSYFGNILVDNFAECFIDLNVPSDTVICEKEPLMLNVSIPNGKYLWQDGSKDSIFAITTSGIYSVQVANLCTSAFYEINVETRNCLCDIAIPIEVTDFDTLICRNESIVLDVSTPGGSYLWENGILEPVREVNSEGVFSVEVSNGCETELLEFDIGIRACACELTAPNVFTPNNDDINETFEIKATSGMARYHLRIFNRWGTLLYESDNINLEWDGTSNGTKVPVGVYYWTADVMCIRGNSIEDNFFKGNVSVVR